MGIHSTIGMTRVEAKRDLLDAITSDDISDDMLCRLMDALLYDKCYNVCISDHKPETSLSLDTYGTDKDGVVAIRAIVKRDGEKIDEAFYRWEHPSHEIGQAFIDTVRFPRRYLPDITHDDATSAKRDIATFFNKWWKDVDIWFDEAGQNHGKPVGPWGVACERGSGCCGKCHG